MKAFRLVLAALSSSAALAAAAEHGDNSASGSAISETTATSDIDWETVVPTPHSGGHHHGTPILETDLTPQERKYWESYNTTTYFTIDTPYKTHLSIHFALLVLSFAIVYPFVMVFNNLDSNWYLPALTVQGLTSVGSCIAYSIFISHVPDLFPHMAYSKMITGLFVLTIVQFTSAVIYWAKRYMEGGPKNPAAAYIVPVAGEALSDPRSINVEDEFIPMARLRTNHNLSPNRDEEEDNRSPSSTLYDRDSFEIESFPHCEHPNTVNTELSSTIEEGTPFVMKPKAGAGAGSDAVPAAPRSHFARQRDAALSKAFEYPLVEKLVTSFGFIATVVYKFLNFGIFVYFLILLPTGIACLNLMGQDNKVFNLLAHFIKGGVFFALGLISLGRYLGAFERMGGAWNYSFVSEDDRRHSLWLRMQPKGSMVTFEMIESCLILFYGCTNVFLEHLADAGKGWSAKDLQHVSIAFMYFGAGLCGVLTEIQLKDWRKAKFFDQVGTLVDKRFVDHVTPGFSPNPFPAFTIFWTGLLMSQHAQSSALATQVHVQWGTLLTYGSLIRIFTFLTVTYFPLKDVRACFKPSRPITELVTSFCLLCGGLVFMESTDQVVAAMEYRGLTPMFTLNVSVGVIALLMAWVMVVFSFKNHLKEKMYGSAASSS